MLSVWKASKYKDGHEYFVDSMETGHNLEHAVSYYFSIAKKQIFSLPLKVISERSVSLFLFERKILLFFFNNPNHLSIFALLQLWLMKF